MCEKHWGDHFKKSLKTLNFEKKSAANKCLFNWLSFIHICLKIFDNLVKKRVTNWYKKRWCLNKVWWIVDFSIRHGDFQQYQIIFVFLFPFRYFQAFLNISKVRISCTFYVIFRLIFMKLNKHEIKYWLKLSLRAA